LRGGAGPGRRGASAARALPQPPVRPAVRALPGAGARGWPWRGHLAARAPPELSEGMGAKRLAVFTHAACFAHDTGPGHVEAPARLGAVVTALRDHVPGLDWLEAPRATRGQLLRVHEPLLLHAVLEADPDRLLQLDPDTVLSPGSPEAALR